MDGWGRRPLVVRLTLVFRSDDIPVDRSSVDGETMYTVPPVKKASAR